MPCVPLLPFRQAQTHAYVAHAFGVTLVCACFRKPCDEKESASDRRAGGHAGRLRRRACAAGVFASAGRRRLLTWCVAVGVVSERLTVHLCSGPTGRLDLRNAAAGASGRGFAVGHRRSRSLRRCFAFRNVAAGFISRRLAVDVLRGRDGRLDLGHFRRRRGRGCGNGVI